MMPLPLKSFVHPHSAYRLEYPAHWDQITEKDGESCGFGPHERDNVGLWISILPFSADTDKMSEALQHVLEESVKENRAKNVRPDPLLRHTAFTADSTAEGQGGQFWVVAGGDIILFASTQVPIAERDEWNPVFQQVMASLQITREKELLFRKIANDTLALLREQHPDQDFEFSEAEKIRGKDRTVYLGNLFREVKEKPSKRDTIIKHFVETLGNTDRGNMGQETWQEVQESIFPVLKPRDYIVADTPTQHLQTMEWLADILICYVIRSKKMYRFVTGWDVERWGTTADALHELAIANLKRLPWPRELMGAKFRDKGQVILVETGDSLASSRLLHPELYTVFSNPLGSPFWAGIPDRDTLVLYSDRRELKQKIGRQIHKDHRSSAYPITASPFLVTRDGIAPQ